MPIGQEKLERRKAAVIEAAKKLLTPPPVRKWEDLTLDDIGQAADVSRATLINYFDSKAGLLDAVLMSWCDELATRTRDILKRDGDLYEMYMTVWGFVLDRPPLAEALLQPEWSEAKRRLEKVTENFIDYSFPAAAGHVPTDRIVGLVLPSLLDAVRNRREFDAATAAAATQLLSTKSDEVNPLL